MKQPLTDLDAVQAAVGKLGGSRDLKVIGHIDAHARRWLSYSNIGFLAFGHKSGLALTVMGGVNGFAEVNEGGELLIKHEHIDSTAPPKPEEVFGSLFLVPGLDETLRINGVVQTSSDGTVTLKVQECYLHCAKALMRSDFWSAVPSSEPVSAAECRFMVVATVNQAGQADVSPKGDPEGKLLVERDQTLFYSERPGNRRIDSFRNILEQPNVSIAALRPGTNQIVEISGEASIFADENLRRPFAVSDKLPSLVTQLDAAQTHVTPSPALQRASLWPCNGPANDIVPADIFKAHVKLSKEKGVGATIARAAVSVPGLLQKNLEKDYEKNLY